MGVIVKRRMQSGRTVIQVSLPMHTSTRFFMGGCRIGWICSNRCSSAAVLRNPSGTVFQVARDL